MSFFWWTFHDLENNPYDETHKPTDPDALYDYALISPNGNVSCSGINYTDVQLLMGYFGAKSVREIKGLSFQSEYNQADKALDNLLKQIRNSDTTFTRG